MQDGRALLLSSVLLWACGYFAPDAVGRFSFTHKWFYFPKWLNGILRRKHISRIPDSVISVSALGGQFCAVLLILLYIGFRLRWAFLDSVIFIVGGIPVSIILGGIIAVIIGKFSRPYFPEATQSTLAPKSDLPDIRD